MEAPIVVPKRAKRDCTGSDVKQGYLINDIVYTFSWCRGDLKACRVGRFTQDAWQTTGEVIKLSSLMENMLGTVK